MDLTSLIGVILGLVALLVGMTLKGVTPDALMNPAAILIILVGTAATIVIAFPGKELKKVPKLFKVLFTKQKLKSNVEIITLFSEWSNVARKEGLLALEERLESVDDEFLKTGLSLAIDGQSGEVIRDLLTEEVDAMEERHHANASIFTQAGTYAPTLGVLGAVVGLIAALKDMNDIDKLGHAISAAFVATLLGIFTGYVLWHPFANKLKRKSAEEVQQKMMIIEGVLSIQEGESASIVKRKLSAYLDKKERLALQSDSEKEKEV